MPPHRGRARSYPYYKVQSMDPKLKAWRDHRREAFDRLDDAIAFRSTIPMDVDSRIVEWREDGAHAMELGAGVKRE